MIESLYKSMLGTSMNFVIINYKTGGYNPECWLVKINIPAGVYSTCYQTGENVWRWNAHLLCSVWLLNPLSHQPSQAIYKFDLHYKKHLDIILHFL